MIKEIWTKSNIITFIEMVVTTLGIYYCFLNKIEFSVILLVIAGICDAFDGTFAKKFQNTDDLYGVQLDSLADMFSFGILPISICIAMGFQQLYAIVVYAFFVICGITRLAYYNVQSTHDEYFHGLPITCSAIILPFLFLFAKVEWIFLVALVCLSLLYVLDIKIKKWGIKGRLVLAGIGICAIILTIIALTH